MHSTAQHSTAQHSTAQHKCSLAFSIALAALLAACGGGGSSSSGSTSSTITGTAAVGSPIVGATANIKCASSTSLPTSTTTNTGGLSITLTGQTFPCAIQISGGTINSAANTATYHSIAMSAGNVNATPLTDLMIANLAGNATPSAWFASLTTAQLAAISQTRVNTALTNLQAAFGSTLPTSINPITTSFSPDPGVQMDDVLSALAKAMTSNGTSHATLLTNAGAAAGAGFTTPAGFNAAFATGFTKTLTGGGIPSITSFAPTAVALGGTVTITGTNLLPVTQVIFTGPAVGTNSSPTVLSNSRTVGIQGTQTTTSIAVALPSYLVTGSYAVSVVHPGGELTATGTLIVNTATVAIPNAPTSMIATATSSTQIDLSWSASNSATGYNVYRSTSPGVAVIAGNKISTITSGATVSYSNTGSSTATKYYYVVTATNASGESVASSEVNATTGGIASGTLTVSSATPVGHNGTEDMSTALVTNSANVAAGLLPSRCDITYRVRSSNGTLYDLAITFRQSDQLVTSASHFVANSSFGWGVGESANGSPITSGISVNLANRQIIFNSKAMTGLSTNAATLNGTITFPAHVSVAACGQ